MSEQSIICPYCSHHTDLNRREREMILEHRACGRICLNCNSRYTIYAIDGRYITVGREGMSEPQ